MMNDADTLIPLVAYHITVERVKDLLTSAFEGGSNYWVEVAERVGEAQDRKQAPFLCDAPFVKDYTILYGLGFLIYLGGVAMITFLH